MDEDPGMASQQLLCLRHDERDLGGHHLHRRLEALYAKARQCLDLHKLNAARGTLNLSLGELEDLLAEPQWPRAPPPTLSALPCLPRVQYVACKELDSVQQGVGQLLQVLRDAGLACGLVHMSMPHAALHPLALMPYHPCYHSKGLSNVDIPALKLIYKDLAAAPIGLLVSLVDARAVCSEVLWGTCAVCAVASGSLVCASALQALRSLSTVSRRADEKPLVALLPRLCALLEEVAARGLQACADDEELDACLDTLATLCTTATTSPSDDKQGLSLAYGALLAAIPDQELVACLLQPPPGTAFPTLEILCSSESLGFAPLLPPVFQGPAVARPCFPFASCKLNAFARVWLMLPESVMGRRAKKIVFAESRSSVSSLGLLMRRLNRSSYFNTVLAAAGRPSPFVGVEILLGLGMDSADQMQAIGNFKGTKEDDPNLLLSTDVAEEGLDIATCKMVVHFDNPKHPCSLIQRHGRARDADSIALFIAGRQEQGADALQDIALLLQKEREMKDYSSGGRDARSCGGDDNDEDAVSPLGSLAYAARDARLAGLPEGRGNVAGPQAVGLLIQFCSLLPHDSYYSPAPIFYCTESADPGVTENKVSPLPTPSQSFRCPICKVPLDVNCESSHFNGRLHKKRARLLGMSEYDAVAMKAEPVDPGVTENKVALLPTPSQWLRCPICKVLLSANGESSHFNGRSHKYKARLLGMSEYAAVAMKAEPVVQGVTENEVALLPTPTQWVRCPICAVPLDVNNQWSHFNGRLHKKRARLLGMSEYDAVAMKAAPIYAPMPLFDDDDAESLAATPSISSLTASAFLHAPGHASEPFFVYSLLLPTSVHPEIRCIVGPPSASKDEAKVCQARLNFSMPVKGQIYRNDRT